MSLKITNIRLQPHLPDPFWSSNGNVPGKLDQYHGYWCPGSLCCQVISNHCIDCWINGSSYSTRKAFCVPALLRHITQCNYIFRFPITNSAWQGKYWLFLTSFVHGPVFCKVPLYFVHVFYYFDSLMNPQVWMELASTAGPSKWPC